MANVFLPQSDELSGFTWLTVGEDGGARYANINADETLRMEASQVRQTKNAFTIC